MNRREFGRLFAGFLLLRRAHGGDLNPDRQPPAAGLRVERHYRADAQILILSLPVFRRSGVGAGMVSWREWGQPDGLIRLLEFTAYSNPDRAAGLNRIGFLRESSRHHEQAVRETDYLGVMTASPEESAEEARKALHSTATQALYTAIRGRIADGQVETAVAHFTGPARLSSERRTELLARAEKELAAAPAKPSEFHLPGVLPPPFLHALANQLRAPASGETRYVYSGRLYRLQVRQTPDPKAAAYFRERGVIRSGAGVVRAAGKVRRESGGPETGFRLWVEQGAAQPVPLRIEFRPKTYLRLVMEAEA